MANYVPDGNAWVPDDVWTDRVRAARAAGRGTPDTARRMLAGQRRALSVRRPWANLIMTGHKTVENRTWTPGTRGDIVIHAGQKWEPVGAALAGDLGIGGVENSHCCPGGYLGTVRLVDVHLAVGCCAPWGQQEVGTYHWVLSDPMPFEQPIPGPGRLGLYWPPADLVPPRKNDTGHEERA